MFAVMFKWDKEADYDRVNKYKGAINSCRDFFSDDDFSLVSSFLELGQPTAMETLERALEALGRALSELNDRWNEMDGIQSNDPKVLRHKQLKREQYSTQNRDLRSMDKYITEQLNRFKSYATKITDTYVECGCCGHYHLSDFYGDCRDDENRFTLDQIPADAKVVELDYGSKTE